MRRPRRPAQELRAAIECLPTATRRAMLDGVHDNRIIVGAYTDREGGVCPMLAAHRRGGRTSLASFARAWDRYTGAKGRAREATDRELRTLTTMLETSLDAPGPRDPSLRDVVARHRAGRAAHDRSRSAEPAREDRGRDTGERDRTGELRSRPGWSWLRPFRRLDAYEAALERLGEDEAAARSAAATPDPNGGTSDPVESRRPERV